MGAAPFGHAHGSFDEVDGIAYTDFWQVFSRLLFAFPHFPGKEEVSQARFLRRLSLRYIICAAKYPIISD